MLSLKTHFICVVSLFISLNAAISQTPRTFLSVETYAGSLNSTGNANGPRLDTRFNGPVDMVFDNAGNLYIAEQFNHAIRIMSPDGVVSHFVGSTTGVSGFVDDTGSSARFNEIRGITLDNEGNLIVADKENHAIRKVTPAGVVTTIAGTGTSGFIDGTGTSAMFRKPNEVLVSPNDEILVADTGNNRIRKIDTKGVVSTLIGLGTAGYEDGDITQATLSNPAAIGFDSSGNLIVTVRRGLRKYDFNSGEISTITGGPDAVVFQDGDKDTAGFDSILGLLVDEGHVFYIVERHAVRHVSLNGDVTTLAGSGTQGTSSGAPLNARFHFPRGIVKTPNGNFLVADRANQRVQRILTESAMLEITSSNPSDNALEFNSSEISISFNKNIFTGRGTISIFDADTDAEVRRVGVRGAKVSTQNNKVTINIGNPLPRNRNFYLQVPSTAIRDTENNFFEGISDKTTLNFSSTTDLQIVSSTPMNGATEFAGTQITLTFNRNIVAGRGRLSVRDTESDMEITGAGVRSNRVSIADNTVTLDLLKPLPVNKDLYLRIPGSAFEDINGIRAAAILNNNTLGFSTVTFSPLMIVASNPMDDGTDFSDSQISLVFNRDIVKGRGRLVIRNATNDQAVFSTGVNSENVSITETALLIDLPRGLPSNTELYLNIPRSAIKDDNNVPFAGIADKTTLNFTTDEDDPSTKRDIDLSTQDQYISTTADQETREVYAYPNPASTNISFDLSEMQGPVNLQIIGMNGNVTLVKKNINKTSITVGVSDYTNGIYIARIIQSDGLSITRKFMIQH